MDIVVYLALAVLAAVFLFSLFILIVMCHRRYEYNRLLMVHSLKFSKLQHDNLDDVLQLGPHISQQLSSNQWVEEVSGILQHCVSVLKLSHLLTDKMSKIQLNQINPQLNNVICQATTRVVPRFDTLLSSLGAKNVDIRVIEARVSALINAFWALVTPFYLLSSMYEESLGKIIHEMEKFHAHLQLALEQLEDEYFSIQSTSFLSNGGSNLIDNDNRNIDASNEQQVLLNSSINTLPSNSIITVASIESSPLLISKNQKTNEESSILNEIITLRSKADDASSNLLNDEAPADPACF